MNGSARRPLRYVVPASLTLAAAAVISLWTAPASPADADEPNVYLPFNAKSFDGPWIPPEPVEPGPTSVPSGQPTDAPATATPSTEPTEGPTPTPTLPGNEVGYEREPGHIVLQIGTTDTDEISSVWEEMNGTPMITVYGDGRVIAAHGLKGNLDQVLFEGRVSEYTLQLWLRVLVHEAGFYRMKDDYQHPRGTKPEIHVWLETEEQSKGKRTSLRGFFEYERRGAPDDEEDAESIGVLVQVVRAIEAAVQGSGDGAAIDPYTPECFTILAQKTHRLLADPPKWEGDVGISAIAAAAPTAASNYVDKVVGHRFVDTETGLEVQELTIPLAKQWFPFHKRAMEFKAGSRPHAVGARREVPGGSWFLPELPNPGGWGGGVDRRRSYWYRRDAGSGSCPSLPWRPAPGGAEDVFADDGAVEQLIMQLRMERGRQLSPLHALGQFLPPGG